MLRMCMYVCMHACVMGGGGMMWRLFGGVCDVGGFWKEGGWCRIVGLEQGMWCLCEAAELDSV